MNIPFFIYISILKNNAIEAVFQLNMDKRSVYIILSESVIYDENKESRDSMANYYSLTKEEFQITKNDIVLEDWKTIEWNTIENVDMQNDEFISSKMFATQSC